MRRQLVQLQDATFATGSAMGLRHHAWQSGDRVVGVFVHGHDQHTRAGVRLANRTRCCRPVMSGCVRPSGRDPAPTLAQADCFRVARRFGLHIDPRVALEHATQAFAVKLVVIRDQQAYWVDNCQWPHMSIGAHVHGL